MTDLGARVVSDNVALSQAAYGVFVVDVAFRAGGGEAIAVLANGTVLCGKPEGLARGAVRMTPLDCFVIGAQPGQDASAMLIGTDDGRLIEAGGDGSMEVRWTGKSGWIEQIVAHPPSGLCGVSQERAVWILDPSGVVVAELDDHPSTPTGLAFSPDGSEVAVSHYDGVSIWDVAAGRRNHKLFWHGSHTGVSWSPDGRYIVTFMQDKELHCWRMPEAKGMRMSGYPAKIRALSWTADSAFVVAGGADTVTSWYVAEGGPAGRAPMEFGYVFNGFVTRVAAHPTARRAAGGYNEGTVLVGGIETGDAVIARPPGGGGVTALAWSPDGDALLAGTERGDIALMEFGQAAV